MHNDDITRMRITCNLISVSAEAQRIIFSTNAKTFKQIPSPEASGATVSCDK